jgi:hypothetical protein
VVRKTSLAVGKRGGDAGAFFRSSFFSGSEGNLGRAKKNNITKGAKKQEAI